MIGPLAKLSGEVKKIFLGIKLKGKRCWRISLGAATVKIRPIQILKCKQGSHHLRGAHREHSFVVAVAAVVTVLVAVVEVEVPGRRGIVVPSTSPAFSRRATGARSLTRVRTPALLCPMGGKAR